MSPEVNDRVLKLSEVEKVTSVVRLCIAGPDSVRPQGEYFNALEPNAFGLPAVDSCPGKTDECQRRCYAIGSEERTATRESMEQNYNALLDAKSIEGMTDLLRNLIASYSTKADRLGIPEGSRDFRIHWDGDFFSVDYAKAWRTVIEENPNIRFWAYTRSYQPDVNVVPELADVENLELFLSVDCQNVGRAREVLDENQDRGLRVAYLVDYYDEVYELQEKLGRTEGYLAPACPENLRNSDGKRRLPVISEKGGACAVCRICLGKPKDDPEYIDKSNWDIVFVAKGYRHDPRGLRLLDASSVPIELKPRRKKTEDRVEEQAQLVGAASLFDVLFF